MLEILVRVLRYDNGRSHRSEYSFNCASRLVYTLPARKIQRIKLKHVIIVWLDQRIRSDYPLDIIYPKLCISL